MTLNRWRTAEPRLIGSHRFGTRPLIASPLRYALHDHYKQAYIEDETSKRYSAVISREPPMLGLFLHFGDLCGQGINSRQHGHFLCLQFPCFPDIFHFLVPHVFSYKIFHAPLYHRYKRCVFLLTYSISNDAFVDDLCGTRGERQRRGVRCE